MNKDKNREYWRGRFEQLQKSLLKPGDEYLPELKESYNQAQRIIEKDIAMWYQRFANNNGIADIADARRILTNAELKELKWDLNEYIKYGKENAINQKWIKELENASARVHISRLEAIKLQSRQAMEKLYGNIENKIEELAKNTYSDSFYKTAFEIAKGTGVGTSLVGIDENMLNRIVKKPWAADEKNFSERIWGYKTTAINTIHDELKKGLMSGRTVDEMSKSLAKAAHTKESYARRLVLTESAYFSSLGSKDCFNTLNVEKFEVLGTLDKNTCSKCGKLDGKVYDMRDFEAGVTAPPFHCHCRCTTVPYFDDEFTENEKRFARDEKGKSIFVDSNMKFGEWKEKFVNSKVKKEKKADSFSIKLSDGVTIDEVRNEIEAMREAISLVPEKVQNALENGTDIIIGKIGSSQYDYINDILYVAQKAEVEDVVHEIGHMVEAKLISKKKVAEFRAKIVGKVEESDIIIKTYRDNEYNPRDIFILQNDNFVSEYQGRVYVGEISKAFDENCIFRIDKLWEFISEPFREYIMSPDTMKINHKEFYDFLKEELK